MHLCLTVWPQGQGCWKMEVICPHQVVSDPSVPPSQCSVSSSLNCEMAHLCIKLTVFKDFETCHASLHVQLVRLHVAVCMPVHTNYMHTYFVQPMHAQIGQQTLLTGSAQLCVCVRLCDGWSWRWPLLRAVSREGPPVTLGHLGTLITNPFLLAFIRPAESYCPASVATHPLHLLSAFAIHKALINLGAQVSLHHYTFIRSCSYQPAGPEYGNGIPATDKAGLDYP